MCNIAGYIGKSQAAPILLEMLRKQELYDGDMSTGIATIHEGKLYYKKLVGNVDEFLQSFDLSELPGTIGIAHTRPGGNKNQPAVHPNFNPDETMAIVTNGTSVKTYRNQWEEAAVLLNENGYDYPIPDGDLSRVSNSPKLRLWLVDYYMKQGLSITEALAKATGQVYSDNVSVVINENYPDSIFALRTTRPMNVILENGEAYMATTRYAFPEHLQTEPVMLPVGHACQVRAEGIQVTKHRMPGEPVMEMTPYTYAEGYRRIEALLKSEKAPLYFDELEFAIGDMRDLWPGDHTLVQHARLGYDLLWQFDREGRLRREVRVQEREDGRRRRYYMWLED